MKSVFAKVTNAARMGIGLALVFAAFAATASAGPNVPEIDPGSMGSAMTLLLGGAMLLKGRLRKS